MTTPKILILTTKNYCDEIFTFLNKSKINFDLALTYLDNKSNKRRIKKLNNMSKKKYFIFNKKITEKKFLQIQNKKYDYIISVLWPHLLSEKFLKLPKYFCVNIHLAYLPFNRGKNSNVWPLIDSSPAGVTSHVINNTIDGGDIIYQTKVNKDITDTGKTLHKKLLKKILPVFKNTLNILRKKNLYLKKQNLKKGSINYAKDFRNKLSEINLKKKIFPLDLINILRAKNYKPYPLPFFKYKGKKIFVEINLFKSK